jgi:hypothetical protein
MSLSYDNQKVWRLDKVGHKLLRRAVNSICTFYDNSIYYEIYITDRLTKKVMCASDEERPKNSFNPRNKRASTPIFAEPKKRGLNNIR